jgi:catechol 2,3-dioxygenase-like lactoylglutathione lyase family enzyme
MKLGYTIIYVPDVESSLRFFVQAFGLEQKFLYESSDSKRPSGMEIALVTQDVHGAHRAALEQGARAGGSFPKTLGSGCFVRACAGRTPR